MLSTLRLTPTAVKEDPLGSDTGLEALEQEGSSKRGGGHLAKEEAKKPKSDKLRSDKPPPPPRATVRQLDLKSSAAGSASLEGPGRQHRATPVQKYKPVDFNADRGKKTSKSVTAGKASGHKRKSTGDGAAGGGAGGGPAADGAQSAKKNRTKQTAAVVIHPAMTEQGAVEFIQKTYQLDYTSEDFPKIASLVAKLVTATTAHDDARHRREKAQQAKVAAVSEYEQAKRELDFGKANIEVELLETRQKVRELEAQLEEAKKNSAKDKMMLELKKLAVEARNDQKEAAQDLEAECRSKKNGDSATKSPVRMVDLIGTHQVLPIIKRRHDRYDLVRESNVH